MGVGVVVDVGCESSATCATAAPLPLRVALVGVPDAAPALVLVVVVVVVLEVVVVAGVVTFFSACVSVSSARPGAAAVCSRPPLSARCLLLRTSLLPPRHCRLSTTRRPTLPHLSPLMTWSPFSACGGAETVVVALEVTVVVAVAVVAVTAS